MSSKEDKEAAAAAGDAGTGVAGATEELLKEVEGDSLNDKFQTDLNVNAGQKDNDGSNEIEEEFLDDDVDEEKLAEEEKGLDEDQLNERLLNAKNFKEEGNLEFKEEKYRECVLTYTKGLNCCPLKEKELRAILYSNRSTAKVKLDLKGYAILDCSKALEYNPDFIKVLLRRAKLYEDKDKLDEALADYQRLVELDPSITEARAAVMRLPDQINVRNEKLKTEMFGKLKDLGNMILKPFGLSTNNFQLNQDPNSGGYSINFQK